MSDVTIGQSQVVDNVETWPQEIAERTDLGAPHRERAARSAEPAQILNYRDAAMHLDLLARGYYGIQMLSRPTYDAM
jgi:hypothetical protein